MGKSDRCLDPGQVDPAGLLAGLDGNLFPARQSLHRSLRKPVLGSSGFERLDDAHSQLGRFLQHQFETVELDERRHYRDMDQLPRNFQLLGNAKRDQRFAGCLDLCDIEILVVGELVDLSRFCTKNPNQMFGIRPGELGRASTDLGNKKAAACHWSEPILKNSSRCSLSEHSRKLFAIQSREFARFRGARMAKQPSPVLFPLIALDKASEIPLHRQLYFNFREAILGKQLQKGTQLPSTRELAKHLEVSRSTVINAFEQLLAEGFLTGKIGSGTFVTDQLDNRKPETIASSAATNRSPAPSRIVERLANFREVSFGEGLGPFRIHLPALDLFPWSTWSRLLAKCAKQQTRTQLAYADAKGLQQFRETVASYLRNSRNVRCEPEQIIVLSGSQQALGLAAQVLVEPGDLVWMEDPGYQGAIASFQLNGLTIGPVPVDSEGLDVRAGQQLFPGARLAYVTPSHQFPLGTTMSLQRRLELLNWATTNDAWILEDDYDSEYRYVTRPLSSLQGLSDRSRVIYIGTFSKVLFPALRIGYMVVPAHLVRHFTKVRVAQDIFPPTLFQMVLTEFINEGHFARHLRRMRSVYSERLNEVVESAHRELSGKVKMGVAECGTHVVLHLPDHMDDLALCRQAASHGLITRPLSPCYRGAQVKKGLILGFGGSDTSQLRSAMGLLGRVFHAQQE